MSALQISGLLSGYRARRFSPLEVIDQLLGERATQGVPTTAGCPEFAYTPQVSAPAVERLQQRDDPGEQNASSLRRAAKRKGTSQ